MKHIRTAVILSPGSSSDDLLFSRVAWRIIPFLFICYVISFLDRVNIGFAQLQMRQDLGFSDAMYGLGAAVFYIGYVMFELPSNLLLARFGARRTFTRIMILWGLASVCMLFVSKPMHFYAVRFLLGVFEAGFFPGIVLYLTYWFPQNRRAAVISVFFAGAAVSGVVGGLFSGWIMRDMAGLLGLRGWQWMFVIEGTPAILLAFATPFLLVDKPEGASWLSPAERQRIAELRASELGGVSENRATSLQAFANTRVYLFAFTYFALTSGTLTLAFWMPLIIRDFGVTDVVSISLYTVIPNAVSAIGQVLIARHSDRTGERRMHFFVCALGGALALGALTLHLASLAWMLAILAVACTLIYSALPIFWAVTPRYLDANAAAAGIALISSIGLMSGVAAPWAVGKIRTLTGGLDNAVYILCGLLALSAISMVLAMCDNYRSQPIAVSKS